MVAACSVTSRLMSSPKRLSAGSIVIRYDGTSSPTRMGATMMAGMPPTFGSRRARWLSRDARSTWPSRGWTTYSRTSAAAFSAGTPGAAAVSTSISWVTTATVAAVRSEMSRTTPARSASCNASPDRYRYTVTSSRSAAFSRSRCRVVAEGRGRWRWGVGAVRAIGPGAADGEHG